MGMLGMRMGPFGIFDFNAVDFMWHQTQRAAQATGDPDTQIAADWLKKEFVDKGLLGVKSGKGSLHLSKPCI